MSQLINKIEAFALKSYVSVIPETEKGIALSIVGGVCPDPPGHPSGGLTDDNGGWLNVYDKDDQAEIDLIFSTDPYGEGINEWLDIDKDGFVIGWNMGNMGDANSTDNHWSESEYQAYEKDHYK